MAGAKGIKPTGKEAHIGVLVARAPIQMEQELLGGQVACAQLENVVIEERRFGSFLSCSSADALSRPSTQAAIDCCMVTVRPVRHCEAIPCVQDVCTLYTRSAVNLNTVHE